MKKAVIGGLVVLAIIIVSVVVFSEKTDEKAGSSQLKQVTSNAAEPTPLEQTPSGQYLSYGPDVIANTAGTKLLFFHAPWCPQCRMLDNDIKKQGVPEGVSIIKIDYDSNQSLRQKYGITLQTTFVRVDDQGNFIKKYVAYDEPNLDSVKKNLL